MIIDIEVDKMRVITGSARGRRLRTLEGEAVRPTTEQVKEALFSIIHFDIEGRQVLDLFAGSGQLGIEAVSRGAAGAVFVDSSLQSVNIVKDNIATVGFGGCCEVVRGDALTYLDTTRKQFDIALLDPPYGTGLLQNALARIDRVMSESGIIVCEHPKDEQLPERCGRFKLAKNYRYGKLALTVYRREAENDE